MNPILFKAVMILMVATIVGGCKDDCGSGSFDNRKTQLQNYHGYVMQDKMGKWTTMYDLSSAYKITISNGTNTETIFTTQFWYDKYSIGDTIK